MDPITHVFSHKRYRITFIHELVRDECGKRVEGWCDQVETPAKELVVSTVGDSGFEFLERLVHEALRACFPTIKEATITQAASDIVSFLWRCGVRVEFFDD